MKNNEKNIKYDMEELSKIFSMHSKLFKEEFSKRKEEYYLKHQKESGNTEPVLDTDDFNLAEALYCIVEEIKYLRKFHCEKN
jgi:hypothetical protein